MSEECDLGQLLDSVCKLRNAAVEGQRYTAYRIAALERALVTMDDKLKKHEKMIQYLEKQLKVDTSNRERQIENGGGFLVDTAESSFQLNVGQGFEVNVQYRMDSSMLQVPFVDRETPVESIFMIAAAPPVTPTRQPDNVLTRDENHNLDSFLEDINTPVLEPEKRDFIPTHRKSSSNVSDYESIMDSPSNMMPLKPAPWDGKINWALESSSIFDNQEEEFEVAAARTAFFGGRTASTMWLFQYGIRYIPGQGEKNAFRTVRIENLPLDIDMNTLLNQVCGGEILVARLLNTSSITGHHTALVTFVQQRQAEAFVEYAAKYGVSLRKDKVTVKMLETPTYPMSTEMEKMIFDEGYTRCVIVRDFDDDLYEELVSLVIESVCGNEIEEVKPEQNMVTIQFHSIKMAAVAFELIRGRRSFSGCRLDFAPDPCARPARPVME
ncbi:hypothetical protein NFIA_022830 [Paecilomyces variotii No. 5]|uniref:RRM domain-containing protein n=1 Tax=Byssochlamys spectabilis (strain No. 5 / NBRC 109023) TaxID=1356009 RepID=V5FW57_BYSSN|nr:hypothetical protein NFIA_022830 [Paecilomyces variotii No. 5]